MTKNNTANTMPICRKSSSSSQRKLTEWNEFVAIMMPMLCRIERDKPQLMRRKLPSELLAEIGALWKIRKNALRSDVNRINIQMHVQNVRSVCV